jgi:hypothetical protein
MLTFRICVAIAFVALPPAVFAAADQPTYLIDDFEGPAPLQHWRFESNPGAPPSSGRLAIGLGHREHGAVLEYQLPCERDIACSAYAAALWRPASPLPKRGDPAISLWIRFPPEVAVSLVVEDTSHRTLRFPIRASIEHPKAGDWQYVVIPLSSKHAADPAQYAAGSIKRRVVEIGILVQAREGATVQGSVSFDDVGLRESTETFHADAMSETEPPLPESLQLAPRLGVGIHLLRDDSSLDLARDAGFKFVRMDMLWANVERSGRYRFFAYDALLRALDARGMSVLWILDYGHPDHGGSTPRTPQDIAAFGRFAEAAAAHFKGRNVRYEIWNEPNTDRFWTPAPNSSEYAALLREAVAGIRRADPEAKVSSGGVSRIDQQFLTRAVDPGLASGLTALGIHPYPRAGPETIAPEIESLRDWAARALGHRIEIWDTEWGYSSADEPEEAPSNGHSEAGRRRQAGLAVREILTVWLLGLPLAAWYDLRDDGPDPANPEHNYGLLDASGNEKPAMKAIRTLMGVVSNRKYAGVVRETPAGIHAMRLDGPTDTVLIVWTNQPDGRRAIEYTKQDLISATDLTGEAIQSKNRRSGQARIEIDAASGPIYLRWSTGSRGQLHTKPALLGNRFARSESPFPIYLFTILLTRSVNLL